MHEALAPSIFAAALNCNARSRGHRPAQPCVVASKLAFWSDLIAAFHAGTIDPRALAAGRFDDATLDLFDKHGVDLG